MKADELAAWAADVKEFALQQALSGVKYACFMVTNRKNRCTGTYTVLGFDGKYFWLQNSRGSCYRASAGRMFRSREAAFAPRKGNTEPGGKHDGGNR